MSEPRSAIGCCIEAGRAVQDDGLPVALQGPCTTECCDMQEIRHIHPGIGDANNE